MADNDARPRHVQFDALAITSSLFAVKRQVVKQCDSRPIRRRVSYGLMMVTPEDIEIVALRLGVFCYCSKRKRADDATVNERCSGRFSRRVQDFRS